MANKGIAVRERNRHSAAEPSGSQGGGDFGSGRMTAMADRAPADGVSAATTGTE
jgi:hypothetical protein